MNTCYIKGTIHRRLLRLVKWNGSSSAIFWSTRVPVPVGYLFADNQRREVFRGTLVHVPLLCPRRPVALVGALDRSKASEEPSIHDGADNCLRLLRRH